MSIIEKLQTVEKNYNDIVANLSDSALTDNRKIQEYMKKKSEIEPVVEGYKNLQRVLKELSDIDEMLDQESDKEIKEMAEADKEKLTEEKEKLENDIKLMFLPKDKNEGKNIIMEIRAGTGGEESALFVADLYRMYFRFIERNSLRMEMMDESPTGLGGYKEIVFSISGKEAYKLLKFESGTHRVQRIPQTESGGRIHTSAATVAVMPEAEETDVIIKEEDLRIDVCRAGGPGGQCVNTTDSAVRITHIPSGIVVQCQDEKSQHKNKAKALKVLRARLYEKQETERKAEESAARKKQIGTGDRSERIRTYNFPQNRVTDHRVNITLYKLDRFMDGEIGEIVDALNKAEREELLAMYGEA